MLRIAHVITRLIQGGADENTLLSCNGQAALGHEVHLIFGAQTSPAMLGRLHPLVRPHRDRESRKGRRASQGRTSHGEPDLAAPSPETADPAHAHEQGRRGRPRGRKPCRHAWHRARHPHPALPERRADRAPGLPGSRARAGVRHRRLRQRQPRDAGDGAGQRHRARPETRGGAERHGPRSVPAGACP